MRLRLLVLCAGIAAHSRVRTIPAWIEFYHTAAVLALVFVLAVLLSSAIRRTDAAVAYTRAEPDRRLLFIRHGACLSLLFASGFLWAMLMAQHQLAQQLPVELEGVDFWLSGDIEGLVRREQPAQNPASSASRTQRSQQFDLRVHASCFRLLPEQCQLSGEHPLLSGQLVTLNDYGNLPVQSGERWQFRVRVNRPHGFSNPGAYDFEAGQFQRGIMARGYIRDTSFNRRLLPDADGRSALTTAVADAWRGESPAAWPAAGIDALTTAWAELRYTLNISRIRAALASDINNVSGLENSGLIKALVIGDRDGISSAQWDLFTATGTNHLVVISGLHVGFVALSVWTLINAVSRLLPPLLLYMPAQHLAAVAAIVAAAAYSLLAGFSLPTQRALIMIVVLMAGRLWGREVAPGDSLSLAALLVLLMDPMAVTQAGFWLSFAAVGSLFLAFTAYKRPHLSALAPAHLWQRWVQPQWAVTVGLLLPLLLWTGQMSLNAPLANVFAIPLVSLLVVPMALVAALLLSMDLALADVCASWLLLAADNLLAGLQLFLAGLGVWTPGLWRPAAPTALTMIMMALASVLLLLPRGLVPRTWALLMLLPLLWPTPLARPAPGRVWLQFLDVGQGLAVAVHTNKHNLLYDTGPALGPDFDAGRAVVLPYLYQAHIRQLDRLMISHWHADHSGGLASITPEIGVTHLLAGAGGNGFDSCEAGQHWRWDEVSFRVLYPPVAYQHSSEINNSSCVLLIEAGGQTVLLTGDIEEAGERWLLREYGEALAVDVLQAPHHGSRSSSTPAFVQATAASLVIMSAGHRNRFGHPHTDVIERYHNNGAKVFFTADSGAILIEIGGPEPRVLSRHRQQQRRFWFNL